MGGRSGTRRNRAIWAFTAVLALVVVGGAAAATAISPMRARGSTDLREGSFATEESPSGDPILADALVVLPFGDGYTAYDIETGLARWESATCDWPASAAPAGVRNGLTLVVKCGAELRMLDLETGEFLWSRQDDLERTMLRATQTHVAVSLGSEVVVLDAQSGSERFRWEPDTEQYEDLTVGVADDLVLIGTDRRLWALDPDGDELWSAPVTPSSVWVMDRSVLVREPERRFRSLDLETGEELEAETMRDVTTPYSMMIGSHEGIAVLALNDDESMLYAVNGVSTELAWKSDGDTWLRGFTDGTVAISDLNGCAALRASDGDERFRCPEGAVAFGVDGKRVAVVTSGDDSFTDLTIEVSRIDQ